MPWHERNMFAVVYIRWHKRCSVFSNVARNLVPVKKMQFKLVIPAGQELFLLYFWQSWSDCCLYKVRELVIFGLIICVSITFESTVCRRRESSVHIYFWSHFGMFLILFNFCLGVHLFSAVSCICSCHLHLESTCWNLLQILNFLTCVTCVTPIFRHRRA